MKRGTITARLLAGLAAASALSAALLLGCANKPPEIARVYARVIYQHDPSSGANTEALSVFLVASDPDGMENLSSFYVINDDAELFWKVDSTSWVTSTAEGETWIGSNSLDMPGSASLPAGDYRVILQNAGGDTVEESFIVPSRPVSAAEASYPAAAVSDGAIRISGAWQNVEVWTYGKDGKFVASFPAARKGPPLALSSMAASMPVLAQGFTFRVFAGSAKDPYNVLTGPYTAPGLGPAPSVSGAPAPQPAPAQPASAQPAPAPPPSGSLPGH